jgi:hypothetical protein
MNAENPYSSPTLVGSGYKLPFARVFIAWLSFCLMTLFATIAISLAIGALSVGILVAFDVDRSTAMSIRPIYALSCSYVVPIPVSLVCYWWTVHRLILRKIPPPQEIIAVSSKLKS